MNKIISIARKELRSYFKTPIAYIILFLTISIFNVFFFIIIDQNRECTLRDMFKLMEFIFVFIIPILTMRTFAEERRSGTLEFLLTSPTTTFEIVIGKYFGSLLFLTVMIALSGTYVLILEIFGTPDQPAILLGYFGIWLEGALFIAIGILTSSLTRNQMIAAMTSYSVLLTFYFSISFVKYADLAYQPIIRAISFWSHLENLSAGLLVTSDIVYFLSFIVVCLALTKLCLDAKR